MIDHLAMRHVENYYLRIFIVVLWNLCGMALMWWAMFGGFGVDGLAVVGGGMFLSGLVALCYKSTVPVAEDAV